MPFTGVGPDRTFAPSLNVTEPVVTRLLLLTVAVNVTGCPLSDGFRHDASHVDVVDGDAASLARSHVLAGPDAVLRVFPAHLHDRPRHAGKLQMNMLQAVRETAPSRQILQVGRAAVPRHML